MLINCDESTNIIKYFKALPVLELTLKSCNQDKEAKQAKQHAEFFLYSYYDFKLFTIVLS